MTRMARAADPLAPLVGVDGTAPGNYRVDGATLRREALDLLLEWPDGTRFGLCSIRETSDGTRGELTVTDAAGRRLSWGAVSLSNLHARELLCKKLERVAPGRPWAGYLEEGAWRLTRAARDGEPLAPLVGRTAAVTRELMPRLLYEGEPTLVYADGDTGKSLFAVAVAVAVQAGAALPFGLKPARAVPVAFLDWEASRDTIECRLAMLSAGLGIEPPKILYKPMVRPLVDEAGTLAAEFARHRVGLVVVDSKVFALSGGEGAAFHEPVTAFYRALRLFAPAASLVLNHVTNADARSGSAARPFGGAFAFNGPRLIWEAKRDQDVTDATAIAFTCRKANNLPRRPDPFGLKFESEPSGAILVSSFDLAEAGPQTLAAAPLAHRITLALSMGALTVAEMAEHLGAKAESVARVLRRLQEARRVVQLDDTKPHRWGLAAR